MPILILGSGRCGTSMVARMLNICGLHIGAKDDMPSGDSSNPTGYWEHLGLCEINQEILAHYNGSDILPPLLEEGWQEEEWLKSLADRALPILAKLSERGDEWGWKDPKAGWTVPFWKKLIPDLKIIICFRNPVDVLRSFDNFYNKQGALLYKQSSLQGYLIWYSINDAAIRATAPEDRIFTEYNNYFPDYHVELAKLLNFIGLPDLERDSAADLKLKSFHDPSLIHHNTSSDDTITAESVPQQVKDLYSDMIAGVPTLKNQSANISFINPESLRTVDYHTVAQIEQLNLKLIARNKELESILSSRTHQIAKFLCSLLIQKEHRLSALTSIVWNTTRKITSHLRHDRDDRSSNKLVAR